MNTPACSVILPAFNRLDFLRQAVESVRAQTFADWELILADDGSDAPTHAWLARELRAPRERVLWLPHSGNPAHVRNAALEEARGEFIAFIDSDDCWQPRKLEAQLAVMRAHPQVQWSYTAIRRITADGALLAGDQYRGWVPVEEAIFEALVQQRAGLALPTVVARREFVLDVGGFDETLAVHEDFDLWLRMARRSAVKVLSEPLTDVRCHDQHYSDAGVRSMRAWDQVLTKYESRVVDPALRRLLRRERARNAVRLARFNARQGDTGATFSTLAASFARGWAEPHWWHGATLAALRLALPRSVSRRGWMRT